MYWNVPVGSRTSGHDSTLSLGLGVTVPVAVLQMQSSICEIEDLPSLPPSLYIYACMYVCFSMAGRKFMVERWSGQQQKELGGWPAGRPAGRPGGGGGGCTALSWACIAGPLAERVNIIPWVDDCCGGRAGQPAGPGRGGSSGRRAAAAAASKHRDRAGGRSANSAGRQLRRVRGQGAAAGPAQGNALRRAGGWGRGSYMFIYVYILYI